MGSTDAHHWELVIKQLQQAQDICLADDGDTTTNSSSGASAATTSLLSHLEASIDRLPTLDEMSRSTGNKVIREQQVLFRLGTAFAKGSSNNTASSSSSSSSSEGGGGGSSSRRLQLDQLFSDALTRLVSAGSTHVAHLVPDLCQQLQQSGLLDRLPRVFSAAAAHMQQQQPSDIKAALRGTGAAWLLKHTMNLLTFVSCVVQLAAVGTTNSHILAVSLLPATVVEAVLQLCVATFRAVSRYLVQIPGHPLGEKRLQNLVGRTQQATMAASLICEQHFAAWREQQDQLQQQQQQLELPAGVLLLLHSPAVLQGSSLALVIYVYADILLTHSQAATGAAATTAAQNRSSRGSPGCLWQADRTAGGEWRFACKQEQLLPPTHHHLLQLLGCSPKFMLWVAATMCPMYNILAGSFLRLLRQISELATFFGSIDRHRGCTTSHSQHCKQLLQLRLQAYAQEPPPPPQQQQPEGHIQVQLLLPLQGYSAALLTERRVLQLLQPLLLYWAASVPEGVEAWEQRTQVTTVAIQKLNTASDAETFWLKVLQLQEQLEVPELQAEDEAMAALLLPEALPLQRRLLHAACEAVQRYARSSQEPAAFAAAHAAQSVNSSSSSTVGTGTSASSKPRLNSGKLPCSAKKRRSRSKDVNSSTQHTSSNTSDTGTGDQRKLLRWQTMLRMLLHFTISFAQGWYRPQLPTAQPHWHKQLDECQATAAAAASLSASPPQGQLVSTTAAERRTAHTEGAGSSSSSSSGVAVADTAGLWSTHLEQLTVLAEAYVRQQACLPAELRDWETICYITPMCGSDLKGRDGVLLQAALAAAPGSSRQQQLLFSLCCSLLKFAFSLNRSQQGPAEECRLAAATAAIAVLMVPRATGCNSSASAEGHAAAAGSSKAAASWVPWVMLFGRCCLQWARDLRAYDDMERVDDEAEVPDVSLLQRFSTPPDSYGTMISEWQDQPVFGYLLMAVDRCLQRIGVEGQVGDGVDLLQQNIAEVRSSFTSARDEKRSGPGALTHDAIHGLAGALFDSGMATALLATPCFCNNHLCASTMHSSELQLVKGSGHACGGCRTVRYCCKGCQTEHWSLHKRVCKALSRQRKQQEGTV